MRIGNSAMMECLLGPIWLGIILVFSPLANAEIQAASGSVAAVAPDAEAKAEFAAKAAEQAKLEEEAKAAAQARLDADARAAQQARQEVEERARADAAVKAVERARMDAEAAERAMIAAVAAEQAKQEAKAKILAQGKLDEIAREDKAKADEQAGVNAKARAKAEALAAEQNKSEAEAKVIERARLEAAAKTEAAERAKHDAAIRAAELKASEREKLDAEAQAVVRAKAEALEAERARKEAQAKASEQAILLAEENAAKALEQRAVETRNLPGEGGVGTEGYSVLLSLYRNAAELGNADAQNSLGEMYATGKGGLHDLVQAHRWFNLAALGGDASARKSMEQVEAKMSREQLEQARRQAREWLKSYQ